MKRAVVLAVAAATIAVGLAACGSDSGQEAGTQASSTAESSSQPGSAESGESNDADVMFAQMMIPHHAQAVEMSDLVLAKDGVDERVSALAQQIKDAQAPEIELMRGWLESWGADVPDMSMGDMGSMGDGMGMMSEDDMQALEDADGPTASRLFLEQMVVHHNGAIEMAEAEVSNGLNPDAIALAEEIITAQEAEITEMEALLGEL